MAGDGVKGRWARVLRYLFGGALVVLAGVNLLIGSPWYVCLGVTVVGIFIILGGRRRVFRVGVSRTEDEIVCRYVPWYEGNAYVLNGVVPLMGAAMIGAGCVPGNPSWLRFGGIFLLCISAFFLISNVSMWRRSFLCITPSMLRLHGTEGAREWTRIRRDRVQSIERKLVTYGSYESLQVEMTYQPEDSGGQVAKTVVLGPRLSVQSDNLLNALVVWKDGAYDNPDVLLDRIEGILRGRSKAGV